VTPSRCLVRESRAGVDGRGIQPWHIGQQVGLRAVSDVVCGYKAEPGGNGDVGFGAQPVTDPPKAERADVHDPLDRRDRGGAALNQMGVDAIHETRTNLPKRGSQDPGDRDGNEQTDDRVRLVPTDSHAGRAEQDREAGEPVSPGVQSVGLELTPPTDQQSPRSR